ncbi:MAG: MBL fold metallo-hydrolase [Desulfotomaculaceae bacterium]
MPVPINLGSQIYQIDLHDQEPGRTNCFLILSDKVALIETGPAPGAARIRDALKSLAIPPEKVDYIIVTHIHLDHAGGAGTLARYLTQAKVCVHPRGSRHLIDPSRLAAGARAIYGDSFDVLFGEVLPVPQERVYTPADGETLDLGGGRVLAFHYTPGHARHHFVVHDPVSRGIFSGDALGLRFQALSNLLGFDFTMPSAPPPEFDPPAAVETLERMRGLEPAYIYFTHFGRAAGAPVILGRLKELISVFESIGQQVSDSGGGAKEIEADLWELVMHELGRHMALDREHPAVKFLELDLRLNAEGIAHYFEKMKSKSQQETN